MKSLTFIVLITFAVLSCSNGKPIEDEKEVIVSEGVAKDSDFVWVGDDAPDSNVAKDSDVASDSDAINELIVSDSDAAKDSDYVWVGDDAPNSDFVWVGDDAPDSNDANDSDDLNQPIKTELNLEEAGGHFEGDMQMTPGEIRRLFAKTGLIDTSKRWLKINGLVIVPYIFRAGNFIADDLIAIRVAMNEMELSSCIRFVPRISQIDYIEIISGSGCYSYVGRREGRQELSLQRTGCMRKGTIQHELIHALGFMHMQSHTDRDNFVKIIYANIPGGTTNNNFFKYSSNVINNLSTPYDFYSVMHYSRNAFGIGGKDTIVPRNSQYLNVIGQRVALSNGDVSRIRNMYQC